MSGLIIGPTLAELPNWRVIIILALLFFIATLWEVTLALLTNYLRRRQKWALLKVVKQLKREILVLGIIALSLAALERPLLLICINCSGDDCLWGCGDVTDEDVAAVVTTYSLQCEEAIKACGIGAEPFFSPLSFYQAHILIFVIAAVHILYTALSMSLSLWKIKRWRQYEQIALDDNESWRLSSKYLLVDIDASKHRI